MIPRRKDIQQTNILYVFLYFLMFRIAFSAFFCLISFDGVSYLTRNPRGTQGLCRERSIFDPPEFRGKPVRPFLLHSHFPGSLSGSFLLLPHFPQASPEPPARFPNLGNQQKDFGQAKRELGNHQKRSGHASITCTRFKNAASSELPSGLFRKKRGLA